MEYSSKLRTALNSASKLAAQTGGIICTEHILYGLLCVPDSTACAFLSAYGLSADWLIKVFNRADYRNEMRLSKSTSELIYQMERFAEQAGAGIIGTEHMLYALLDNSDCYACQLLAKSKIDVAYLQSQVSKAVHQKARECGTIGGIFEQDPQRENSALSELLDSFDRVNKIGWNVTENEKSNAYNQKRGSTEYGENSNYARSADKQKNGSSQINPTLLKFGIDLTSKAKDGLLDPVIGRGGEIERVIQILCRRTKNNPVLIGEPGVGKSAVIDGLAQAIVADKVPDILRGKIVFSLDVASLVAGTRYRGDLEERLKETLDEIRKDGRIILFIDEIHMILKSVSAEGGIDIANIMKPMLARGELQTIGATTIEEYRKYFEKDAALERRFQPITVEQPSVSDTIEILTGLREKYRNHHRVEITDEAISAAAILSDRYITDRFLPDKAIDLIDEAASRKKIFHFTTSPEIRELEARIKQLDLEKSEASRHEQYQRADKLKAERDALVVELETAKQEWSIKCAELKLSIGEEEIAEIVANWTGIPVRKISESEGERLARLEKILEERVVGQSEAVTAIAKAIRRARAGLKDPKRPIGSFIFLGPTGVGKTELTKALAEAMFGDENLLVRVDMSEYMEKSNVSKLIGSAPGYVGFEEGGQLTEKIRRKPYSVVLFDEIEKAHPEVFNILLQILEDGRLTDGHGRTVNFKNTVIILTSNIGASEIAEMKTSLGFNSDTSTAVDYESMKEKQMSALKEIMKPELINRIDEIIIFRRLSRENILEIAEIMFKTLEKRLAEKNISVKVTQKAKEYIVSSGFNEEYGARPLRRAIQRLVEDELSEMVLENKLETGAEVTVDSDGEALQFLTDKAQAD